MNPAQPSSEAQDSVSPRDTREVLWHRLLAGEITEVYAPAGYDMYLPQTLGLEPISHQAYAYDTRGEPRDANQLSEIASQLSAEAWWIAGGGPRFWASHFAEHAEVVLVFESDVFTQARFTDARSEISIEGGARWLYQRWRARHRTDDDRYSPMTAPGSFVDVLVVRRAVSPSVDQFLMDQYPEKTFIIRTHDDIRMLRKVRARR